VFYKDESGAVFHTYSCYARGIDMPNATYHCLLVEQIERALPHQVRKQVQEKNLYEKELGSDHLYSDYLPDAHGFIPGAGGKPVVIRGPAY
jgi:hypothetical protein